jgi:hypothetical protein
MEAHHKQFLSHTDAKYAILPEHSYETDGKIMVLVTATFSTKEAMEDHIPATGFTPTGWACDDTKKFCQQKGKVFIQNGRQRIEAVYTKAEEFPYKLLESHAGAIFVGKERKTEADLPIGVAATEVDMERYQRKDDHVVEVKGQPKDILINVLFNGHAMNANDFMKEHPVGTKAEMAKFVMENNVPKDKPQILYPVVIREKTGQPFYYDMCREHGDEFSFKGKQTRHAHNVYRAIPTTRTLDKVTHSGEVTVLTGPAETLLKLEMQEKLGPGQKNRPSCSPVRVGGPLPQGYRIVQ